MRGAWCSGPLTQDGTSDAGWASTARPVGGMPKTSGAPPGSQRCPQRVETSTRAVAEWQCYGSACVCGCVVEVLVLVLAVSVSHVNPM